MLKKRLETHYKYRFLVAGFLIPLFFLLAYITYANNMFFSIKPDQIINYKRVGSISLSLHLFHSKFKETSTKSPAILFFHGGGWQSGSPKQFYRHCRYFSDLGLTCISAQYRIKSIHATDPKAAVQDSRAAFNYLVKNADILDINPEKIIASGGSAGGHLAASLGVSLDVEDEKVSDSLPIRPASLILYNPMVDLSPGEPDHQLVADYWQEISPMQHIDVDIPSTLILLGTEDTEVPVNTAKRFCSEIKEKGGECELELYEKAGHGFFNYHVENGRYFEATNVRIVQYLKQLELINQIKSPE